MDPAAAADASPAALSASTSNPQSNADALTLADARATVEPPTAAPAAPDAAPAQPSGPTASTDPSAPANPPLSKSALKRQRKQEAFQAQKLQRRAHEKEKRKAKAQEVRRLVAEGKMDKPVNKKRRPNGRQEPHGARIAIDMGFDDLMTDKEAKSMASQLAYCYSANRGATHPFPLLITSFNGRLRDAYEKRGDHVSWKGVEWWEDGIEQLYEGVDEVVPRSGEEAAEEEAPAEQPAASTSAAVEPSSSAPAAADAQPASATDAAPAESSATAPSATSSTPLVNIGTLKGRPRTRVPRSTVVYLTGDSPNVLTTLTPGHTYILGGIVDRNRHKNLCLDKANRLGIAHAQLPIGQFLPEMQTRKVLTVNQVFEILVGWVEEGGRDDTWREALRRVMPERKFNAEGRRERRSGSGKGGEGGGADAEGGQGVYIARDDDDEDDEDDAMIVEQVDAAREAAERDEEDGEAQAVMANVDGEAAPQA
ncbi:guanine-1-methyltransferase-domain-containing protein [Rhodotorula diobovata]|uniref:tRNA (guanine(9)-N1)-methyltransferase n=1 Tax=Rhodotorula diobovata TaxID=5288 RepID=A0A5C5G3V8_9BASI|nr:guanine-1-methyltransferase-domain-containing protein [Rhodotorula diobovata]